MTNEDVIDIIYLAAIVEAHSDKFPVPTHAEALAKRVVAACRGQLTRDKLKQPVWMMSDVSAPPKARQFMAAWKRTDIPKVEYGIVSFDYDKQEWVEGGTVVGEPTHWRDFEEL